MNPDDKHLVVGRIQRDFLVEQGLQPHHRLLDIGCGWLRGGEWLINYLDPGNYVGIEKDSNMLEKAHRVGLSKREVAQKRPRIIEGVPTPDLMESLGHFNYALAHSVFTHLLPEQISAMLKTVMPHADVLYASFNRAPTVKTGKPHKNREFERTKCQYPFEELAEIADKAGCTATDLGEFGHPGGQEMAKFWRSS